MTAFFPAICRTFLDRACFSILLLLVYSFLGWCGEMVYCSIGQRRLCEKRGFLNGPLGHGANVVLLVLDGGCDNPILTFFLGAVLTSLVEYVTSFAMEKLFHMRWWDYSHYKFHINGRICLLNSTLFGLASVFLCHAANPPMSERLEQMRAEQQQLMGAQRQRLENAVSAARLEAEERAAHAYQNVQSRLEPLADLGEEFSARLEAARSEAQQKLRSLYEKQDFFERRLMRSFPTLRPQSHGDALRKLREYWESKKS